MSSYQSVYVIKGLPWSFVTISLSHNDKQDVLCIMHAVALGLGISLIKEADDN